jgi:hypothetical protein
MGTREPAMTDLDPGESPLIKKNGLIDASEYQGGENLREWFDREIPIFLK